MIKCHTPYPVILIPFFLGSACRPVEVKEEPVLVRRGEAAQFGWLSCQVDTLISSPWAGDQYVHAEAEGVFWILRLTLKNLSSQDRVLDLRHLRLVTPDNRNFSPRFDLAIYYGDAGLDPQERLGPGGALTGYLIFDLPRGLEDARLRLSNAYFILREGNQ